MSAEKLGISIKSGLLKMWLKVPENSDIHAMGDALRCVVQAQKYLKGIKVLIIEHRNLAPNLTKYKPNKG